MNLIAWMKWHRWAGLGVALFIAMLCVSGILLNHGSALGLTRHYLHSDWLLDLYGIEPAQAPVSFNAGAHWVTRIGDRLYFNGRELAERSDTLLGVVPLQDQIVAGLGDRLLILAPDGTIIEVLHATEGVPAGMTRIGSTPDGSLVIENDREYSVHVFPSLWRTSVSAFFDYARNLRGQNHQHQDSSFIAGIMHAFSFKLAKSLFMHSTATISMFITRS